MFGLFPKDPEVVRVLDRLAERLKNLDEWKTCDDSDFIHHEDFNITVSKTKLAEPQHTWIYLRYWRHRRIIKNTIAKIYRRREVNRLSFAYDVIDGKYPYQENEYNLSDERRKWLEENSKEGEYTYRNHWLYFADDALAMAFKLRFTK